MVVNKIDWNGWKLTINEVSFLVQKDGEHRIYDTQKIVKVEADGQYVFLTMEDGQFYQIKFEDGNFLVVDLFDADGELICEIGSHVFGE